MLRLKIFRSMKCILHVDILQESRKLTCFSVIPASISECCMKTITMLLAEAKYKELLKKVSETCFETHEQFYFGHGTER